MQVYNNRDYQFYGCVVKRLVWDEECNTLTLECRYGDRGFMRICLKGVKKQECVGFMQSHTIDYVISTYVLELDAVCYEIHFKLLAETSKIWAESMEFV